MPNGLELLMLKAMSIQANFLRPTENLRGCATPVRRRFDAWLGRPRMPLAATFLSDYENVSVVSIFIAMVISPRLPRLAQE